MGGVPGRLGSGGVVILAVGDVIIKSVMLVRFETAAPGAALLLFLLVFSPSAAWGGGPQRVQTFAPGADAIVGTWLTGTGDAQVAIYRDGGEFLGKLAWLKEPNGDDGRPAVDDKNPDRRLRGQPILGLVIIHAAYSSGDFWKGRVYDPDSGNTYSCTIRLASPDALKLRGYLGISLFGRTETWKRVERSGTL